MAAEGHASGTQAGPCIKHVRLGDVAAQPWRNGGGLTRELLTWTAQDAAGGTGGGGDVPVPWTLRVSVADITRDGPFSAFAGIARVFTVLEGAGVVLSWPGAERRLSPEDPPLAFDGADAPGCRLVDGPTRDLNLMVRQGSGQPRMAHARPGQHWEHGGSDLAWRGLYTHGAARVLTSQGTEDLGPGTLLWSADAQAAAWTLLDGGPAWWLGLGAAPGARS